MKIAEAKPFLDEILSTPIEPILLRQAKIKAITYSNQIEGNTLTEKQVTSLLISKPSMKSDREIREILNYENALNFADRLASDNRPIKQNDFCDLQRLIIKGLVQEDQTGRIRTIPVAIMNQAGIRIDSCPEPHLLSDLMEDLWNWLKETEGENPFARSFAFHLIAVIIHPFVDGNGRTIRLFQHLLLLRQKEELARYVPSESAVMKYRNQYYLSIRESKAQQSLNPMLEFLGMCFAESAFEVTKEAKKLFKSSKQNSAIFRHKKILQIAKKWKDFQIKAVQDLIPEVSRKTLMRDLSQLVRDKKLISFGELKGRKYRLKK